MSTIINDSLEVSLVVDGQPWHVKEAIVELSRTDTPNYVDILMLPDPEQTAPTLPTDIDKMIGSTFELHVDNSMYSKRDTTATEDTLLFAGNLANISITGKNYYEGIAYDPAQQAFAETAEGGGSISNTTISIKEPDYGHRVMYTPERGTVYEAQSMLASEFVSRATNKLGLTDVDIDLSVEGKSVGGVEGGYDRQLSFGEKDVIIKDGFNKARERCRAEWWFDKEGTFHFGLPEPTRHELKYITDADAGKTTPPYWSVRVIGSGAASAENRSRENMYIEDKVVVEAELAIDSDGNPTAQFGTTRQPVFEYHDLEISTDEQAKSVARTLVDDLSEQQADGKITVVGFPEVVPMDGVVMPDSEEQPMGGKGYNVYKVQHHLNESDGFLTQIHVSGVTGRNKTTVVSRSSSPGYDDERLRADSPTGR